MPLSLEMLVYTKKRKKNFTALSIATYIAITVFLSLYAIERTTFSSVYNFSYFSSVTKILRYFIFSIGLFGCFLYESKLKTVLCTVFFIVSYITHKFSGSYFLFDLFFIPIFLSKIVDFNTIVKIFFYVIVIAVITTVFLDIYEVLPQKSFGTRGKFVRYNLGFVHPNSLGLMLMLLGMLFVLKVKKLTFDHLLVLVLLGIICVVVPNSYTSAYVLFMLAFVLCLIIRFQNCNLTIATQRILFVTLIVIFISIIVSVYFLSFSDYFKDYLHKLPETLHFRFRFGAEAYIKYGLSIFGQPYSPKDTYPGYFIVDSTLFYLPVFIGIVPSIIYMLLVSRAVWMSVKYNNFVLLVVQFLIFIYSISEYIVIYPLFMFAYFNSCPSRMVTSETVGNRE